MADSGLMGSSEVTMKALLFLLTLNTVSLVPGQSQSATSLIDAYSPTSVLSSPAMVPLGTTVVLVCRVGGVASGTQLSYTWTCPNGPCDVGEGNNPNRKTYGDRMVLNVLTSRDGGTYTCLVGEGQDAVHGSSFTLNVQGGTVLSSYNQLIPNNAMIIDNGVTEDTNVNDILPPDGSSSVAVIDCSTDNLTQPLTWTDGAGQPVSTSPNLTVYQTTNGSSAALHIDTTDTSTFTNGRYQCDGGMERAVNTYINQEGATIGIPDPHAFFCEDSVARFVLKQATAERSERYISSLERTDLGVPLEVEFEETQSSGADGDTINRHVSAPGTVYNIKIWSLNGASFSIVPLTVATTLKPETVPSVPRLLSITRILSDGFELNWLPPREPNGRPVYEIEYGTDDTNFTTVDTGSGDTHYNLTGLQHSTTYYIRVVAVNYITPNGVPLRGNESETVTGIVPEQTMTSSTNTVVELTGAPAPTPVSAVTQVQMSTSAAAPQTTSSTPPTTSSTETQPPQATAGNEAVVIIAVCSVILLILTGAAAVVVVAAVLVGLGMRRRRKGQTAGDSAVHYYSTPGPGLAAAEGGGEGKKKESAATDYYEDMGQGGGGEGRKKENTATDYYEDMGQGGGGEGRKKESAATEYEDVVGGVGEVLANPVTAYEELQQSALPYEHVYSTCKRDGLLDGVEHLAGGASGPDNQPTQRVPRREQHYTALNMNTVNKSEYESLYKMT